MTEKDNKKDTKTLVAFAAGSLFGIVFTWLVMSLVQSHRPEDTGATQPALTTEEGSGEVVEVLAVEDNQSALPYSISGLVLDDHGQPVVGATVRAFSDRSNVAQRVETGEDGAFEIDGLALGLYTVEAHAVAFGSAVSRGVTPGGAELVLQLEPNADLVGRVVHRGQGVAGASVFVGGPGVFPPQRVRADEGGYFQVHGLEGCERVELLVVSDELGSGFGTWVLLSERSQVEIELDEAPPLRLEIWDARTGIPVDSGIVSISESPLHVLSISEHVTAGAVEVRGLPQGEYFARVRAAGYLPWHGRVSQSEPARRIALDPGATARGHVVDVNGTPIEDARVSIEIRDDRGQRWRVEPDPDSAIDRRLLSSGGVGSPPAYPTLTGADGAFEFSGIPSGRVVIRAERDGYEAVRMDSMESDGESAIDGIEIVLEPSR